MVLHAGEGVAVVQQIRIQDFGHADGEKTTKNVSELFRRVFAGNVHIHHVLLSFPAPIDH